MASDLIDRLIQYEEGDMELEEIADLFQQLVDSGMINSLQGHYHRMAEALAKDGWIKLKSKDNG